MDVPMNNAFRYQFGEQVRQRRREWSLTQEQLGDRCGCHKNTIGNIERGSTEVNIHTLEQVARDLQIDIETLRRNPCDWNPVGSGLDTTIGGMQKELRRLQEYAVAEVDDSKPRVREPLELSGKQWLESYLESLDQVKESFWTTTYLRSTIWISRENGRIVRKNNELLQRLHPSENNQCVRRLILLNQSPEAELEWRQRQLDHFHRNNLDSEVQEIKADFRRLKVAFDGLIQQGCAVKVVCDGGKEPEYTKLNKQLRDKYDPRETEIAIYDHARVQLFQAHSGVVTHLHDYSRSMEYFPEVLESAELYFSTLWELAQPAKEFLDEVEKIYVNYRTD